MDKNNKNRTDLLAAGRKKLQQFRQKKDGKGGKSSSNKSNKSEVEAAIVATSSEPVVHGEVPELSPGDIVASSELDSKIDSRMIGNDSGTVGQSSKVGAVVSSSIVSSLKLPLEDSGAADATLDLDVENKRDDTTVSHEGGDTSGFHKDAHLETSEVIISEEKFVNSDMPFPAQFLSQGESPILQEQDLGSTVPKQADTFSEIGIERVFSNDGNTDVKEEASEAAKMIESDDASSAFINSRADGAKDMGGLDSVAGQPSPESERFLAITAQMPSEQINVASGSLNEVGQVHGKEEKGDEEHSSRNSIDGSLRSVGSKRLALSSASDSISLSQLALMIHKLDESELKFLLESREAETLPNTWSCAAPQSDIFDAFGRLKDHLYLTSFAEHTSRLQLAEESEIEMLLQERVTNLVEELSRANSSLAKLQEMNEILSVDLTQCRSQLREAVSGRDALEKQLHDSKAELEVLSFRVNDLENKLEISRENLAALSSELADSRNSAATLHTENENLNGRLNMVTEEKTKLAEEREFFFQERDKMATESAEYAASLASLRLENVNLGENIALLREEKMQVYEEKEHLMHENEKLLSSTADLKGMVEVFQAENINSNGALKAVEGEKKKLEEANKFFVHENEKLTEDLMKSCSLVDALQADISNITGRIASLTEERNKLHEEKQNLLTDNESLLHELAKTKDAMIVQQAESSRAVADLKEASLRIEQLTEETVFLRTNSDLHMSEISRSMDVTHQVEDSDHLNLIDNGGSSIIPRRVESEATITMPETISPQSHVSTLLTGQLELGDSIDLSELQFWKSHMEEANEVLERLEKAIENMHSQSASLNAPSGKVGTGVSKLIQAFELKTNTDDNETAEVSADGNLDIEDSYTQTKNYTEHLKIFLKKLFWDAENTSKLIEGERQSRASAEAKAAGIMASYESLKNDSDNLEGENIELLVLFEALRQHVLISETRLGELVLLYEASKKQCCSLNVENDQLREKLTLFHAKISEFQSQLDEICQNSDKRFSTLSESMETLCKEVDERGPNLEGEWNSFVEQIVQAVGKLDASIENLCPVSSSTGFDNTEIGARIGASIDAAIGVMQAQQVHLEANERHREGILSTYTELNKEFDNVQKKNEMAITVLEKIYGNLRKIVAGSRVYAEGSETGLEDEKLMDPLNSGVFDVILQQLEDLVEEKMQLQSVNDKLKSDLVDQVREINELNRRCLDADTILKFFEDAQRAFKLDIFSTHTDEPLSHLNSLIDALIEKYNEAEEQISLAMKSCASNEMHCRVLQEELHHLSFLHVQFEVENIVLKDSSKMVNEDLLALRSKLLEKVSELEQSEQRVSSLREKLIIAVTKGKGLVLQRDSLKQSLAETSNQLEKCSQELQSKDAWAHELEAKIKNYSEAGEHTEALESELSYIRNSATALRESFLLKDSVLQRIEEILEDLELPEQFHAGGIIEKVDWLAKTVNGNTLPLPEWDPKNTVAAASYSHSGFSVMDDWKEEMQPNQNSVDEFRRRYEELQSKFFALAEQNEMLEQSLMERNNLVQRWEDILGRVDVPVHLRSSEPEERIQSLGTALSEAEGRCNSHQQRIDYLDTCCGSLSRDLEESQSRILDLESASQSAILEKESLLTNLEIVHHQYNEASKKLVQLESRNEDCLKEICSLQEKLDERLVDEERLHHFEVEVRQLQDLIREVLQASDTDLDSHSDGIKILEQLLKKLIEKYRALLLGTPVNLDANHASKREEVGLNYHEEKVDDSRHIEVENVLALSKKLEDTLGELMQLKEERDRYKENNQSLVCGMKEFDIKKNELEQLLNQEENKSASLREKLNIAIKKGKSLVQQRDSMKQVIDEVNAEVERMKYEISLREKAIAESEQKIRNLSIDQERVEATESECRLLRDRLAECEQRLQEKENLLSVIHNSLKDTGLDVNIKLGSPLENVKAITKRCHDLRATLDSSQQESRKSKRAAELLLAELNEVQERNDSLQEEVAKVAADLSRISRDKELSEAAKFEALAQLETLSALQSEERDHHLAEVNMLRSNVELLREDLSVIDSLVADVLSKALEILHKLDVSIKSCVEPAKAPDMASLLGDGVPSIVCPRSENKIFVAEIGSLKEKLCRHYDLLSEEASHVSESVKTIYREVASIKQVSGARENDIMQLETLVKEKDFQLSIMCSNMSLLYGACTASIMELENWKAHQDENGLATKAQGVSFKSHMYVDAVNTWPIETHLSLESATSEDYIRTVTEKLLSVVKGLIYMQNEVVEDSRKEMKTVIMNLQKELHEKDIQRDKISMEFVNQIKEAEAAAKKYFQDLQSAKSVGNHLQSQIAVMVEERGSLENRVKELEDRETTFIDLEQRVASLTDILAAKEQEAEALMQALDEEESQMEEMSNKIGELENCLRQKNKDLENLDASRSKTVKKLSVTMNKFDELHQLSESLLAELEKLQSQLQERDGEISFLRQEVTRCTNEALTATQISNKSDEIYELLTWLNMVVSRVRVNDIPFDDNDINQVHARKELLQRRVTSIVSELEELRLSAQNTDLLLQLERGRVEELAQKEEFLENSLREKESELVLLKRVADSGQATTTSSEIKEVEPGINKRATSGAIAPQVRGGRKTNNDQVAIAIDMDPSHVIEDEDDDKAHGFKSFTTSRIIPRFTRPVTDMIDGLWVSCDRALMRQPALRLGLIIYWAILHALLAAFVV